MNSIREEYFSHLDLQFKKMSSFFSRQLSVTENYLKGDIPDDLKAEMKNNEEEIDRLEVLLRKEIVTIIGLQSPRAADLRRIIACYDIIGDLERMADLLCGISRRLYRLYENNTVYEAYRMEIVKIFSMAEKMAQNAIFAFRCENNQMARKVIADDTEVDLLTARIHQKLLTYEGRMDPLSVEHLLYLGRILYNIERIGDGATNIAEATIFLTDGKDIKHQNRDQ